MRRLAMMALALLGALGCGSSEPGPQGATSITVTVRRLDVQSGAWVPLPGAEVKESADVDRATNPPTIVGLVTSATTDGAGKVTFSVPASTSTGNVCVSVLLQAGGSTSFGSECWSLNVVPATSQLDLY